MNIRHYRNNPRWRRSAGEKLGKIHFRDGHLHAECDPVTGSCSEHYDKHDPHESLTELAKHAWASDLGKAAIILGALGAALAVGYVATRR